MPQFMDVHSGFQGITHEKLLEAHQKDQAIEQEEGVRFIKAWADPNTGKAFCLSEAPNMDAVRRVHERAGHAPDEVHQLAVSVE